MTDTHLASDHVSLHLKREVDHLKLKNGDWNSLNYSFFNIFSWKIYYKSWDPL